MFEQNVGEKCFEILAKKLLKRSKQESFHAFKDILVWTFLNDKKWKLVCIKKRCKRVPL